MCKLLVSEIAQFDKDVEAIAKLLEPMANNLKNEEGYNILAIVQRLRGMRHRLMGAELSVKG